jgi:hypothetical protein
MRPFVAFVALTVAVFFLTVGLGYYWDNATLAGVSVFVGLVVSAGTYVWFDHALSTMDL